jgi:hypothetical protein
LGQNGGGNGGSAGNYIINNAFATWVVTGTRLGGVANETSRILKFQRY